jgi:hypothetical protein
MKPRITKNMPQHTPRKRPDMDPKHLENVRGLGCVCCGAGIHGAPYSTAIHAHHLLRVGPGERGLSLTTRDRWAIPLCSICHDKLHKDGNEERWLAERGIDGRAVASALWAARGVFYAMQRVVFRAYQAAQLSANALSVRTNA